jgi:lysozyme
MQIDATGLDKLRALELCRLRAYWDRNGWALGYGQHSIYIDANSTCTKEQAERWFEETTRNISVRLSELIKVPVNQGQFNALVIFTYNVGCNAFTGSHLLQRLNAGDYSGIPYELKRWIYSNHQIDSALETRRAVEIEIWNQASKAA